MRTFVISDIHGQFDAFQSVLAQAKFKLGVDKLYVLGDMIDWGEKSLNVLIALKKAQEQYPDKIKICMGNHEMLCLSAMAYDNKDALNVWLNNRGTVTYNQMMQLSADARGAILSWLYKLDYYFTVDGFYLTHSMPLGEIGKPWSDSGVESVREVIHPKFSEVAVHAVWGRWHQRTREIPDNMILISGHTPVYRYKSDKGIYVNSKGRYIDIDCGAKSLNKNGLACLALLQLPKYSRVDAEMRLDIQPKLKVYYNN